MDNIERINRLIQGHTTAKKEAEKAKNDVMVQAYIDIIEQLEIELKKAQEEGLN